MYNIHPTDFLIFSFDREVSQSKVLFQCPPVKVRCFFAEYEGLIKFKLGFVSEICVLWALS
jgi:hypothetical protein